MSTGWLWDARYAWHDTGYGAGPLAAGGFIQPGLAFAENPATKTRFRDLVEASGLIRELVELQARPATDEELLRLHAPEHLARIRAIAEAGGGEAGDGTIQGDGTPMGGRSYEIALLAAGGALVATEAVLEGRVENAYALVRPPGHHAERARARGFCLFGNTALAALHARERHGLDRVAVIDWDVHHGNGTEDAFYADPSVLTISVHADQIYPHGRGLLEHRGEGAGEGFNVNVPLPEGSGTGAYLAAFERVVIPALHRFRPELVLVASGLDASAMDPLGRQLVHSGGFRRMAELVRDAARELCDGRLVCIHEGGYSEAYVPFCGQAIVEALLDREPVAQDPFLAMFEGRPAQALAPHQDAVIARAEAALDLLPAAG